MSCDIYAGIRNAQANGTAYGSLGGMIDNGDGTYTCDEDGEVFDAFGNHLARPPAPQDPEIPALSEPLPIDNQAIISSEPQQPAGPMDNPDSYDYSDATMVADTEPAVDDSGGYTDSFGNYYDAAGGVTDTYGGYLAADGSYTDEFGDTFASLDDYYAGTNQGTADAAASSDANSGVAAGGSVDESGNPYDAAGGVTDTYGGYLAADGSYSYDGTTYDSLDAYYAAHPEETTAGSDPDPGIQYDAAGGYWDAGGRYWDSFGGVWDTYGGYQTPDGRYIDENGNTFENVGQFENNGPHYDATGNFWDATGGVTDTYGGYLAADGSYTDEDGAKYGSLADYNAGRQIDPKGTGFVPVPPPDTKRKAPDPVTTAPAGSKPGAGGSGGGAPASGGSSGGQSSGQPAGQQTPPKPVTIPGVNGTRVTVPPAKKAAPDATNVTKILDVLNSAASAGLKGAQIYSVLSGQGYSPAQINTAMASANQSAQARVQSLQAQIAQAKAAGAPPGTIAALEAQLAQAQGLVSASDLSGASGFGESMGIWVAAGLGIALLMASKSDYQRAP